MIGNRQLNFVVGFDDGAVIADRLGLQRSEPLGKDHLSYSLVRICSTPGGLVDTQYFITQINNGGMHVQGWGKYTHKSNSHGGKQPSRLSP
jgi:hypothetical protein